MFEIPNINLTEKEKQIIIKNNEFLNCDKKEVQSGGFNKRLNSIKGVRKRKTYVKKYFFMKN